MPRSEAARDERNPFAVPFVKPGAIPYLFPHGGSLDEIVALFQALGRRGEILGPHGSGKSTLIAALLAYWKEREIPVVHYALHAGERRLPPSAVAWNSQTIIVVDGAEQLSWWSRFRLRRRVRSTGAGLLWTTHRPLGLPTLWTTGPDPDVAQAVVDQLLRESSVKVSADDVAATFNRCRGNLRETLFALFDVVQRR